MSIRRAALAAVIVVAGPARAAARAAADARQPVAVRRPAVARHRPAPREPHRRRGRPPQPAAHVLHGARQRRRVEDDRRRAHLDADLRRSADRLDRRPRRRPVGRRTSSTRAAARGCTAPTSPTGNGVYKSADGGKTWTHLGLRDAQQIPRIDVDPRSADRVFVAALGHPYGPNEERGIFRSTDGGRTFQKVLYKDENTGGNDVDIDPSNPDTVYATLWEERQGPWENAVWAGTRRRHLQVHRRRHDVEAADQRPARRRPGEPGHLARQPEAPLRDRRVSRRSRASARTAARPASSEATTRASTWTRITTDTRPSGRIGGGDLPMPLPDPKNPDRIVMASTVSWVSNDGGKTWAAVQGRAGRRGLPERLDQPGQPRHHAVRRGPGRRRDAERREVVEFLVQPADRAALPRGRRQRLPLPRLQRAAGERVGLHLEPRQLRRDLRPRLAAGRRGRVRLRRPRPAGSRHRLRRAQRDAVRPPHRPDVHGRADVGPRAAGHVPHGADDAGAVLAGGQAHAVLRQQPPLEDDGRRHDTGSRSAPT